MELPELFKLFQDWPNPADPVAALERRRKLWHGLSAADLDITNRFLFPDARKGRRAFLKEIAPHLVGELNLAAEVGLAPDLGTLLAILGKRIASEKEIVTREHFEALAMFDLSLILCGIERVDPDHRAMRDLFEIVELLNTCWMQPGDTKVFVSHHDPKDFYRVRHVDIAGDTGPKKRPRLFLREHPFPLRHAKDANISFIFDQRPKDRFLTALKIWKQMTEGKKKDPYLVLDRRAFRFVTHTREEALALVASFCRFMEAQGGRVEVKEDRLTSEEVLASDNNAFSSPFYRDIKLTVVWRGVPFEVQITTLEYWLNAGYSLGEESHALYRLGQGLKFSLPRLYPASVYRTIDKGWNDPDLKKLLRRQTMQRLGWSLAT